MGKIFGGRTGFVDSNGETADVTLTTLGAIPVETELTVSTISIGSVSQAGAWEVNATVTSMPVVTVTESGLSATTWKTAFVNASASGDTTITTTSTTTKAIAVHGYAISVGATATNVCFKSGSTTMTHTMMLGANGGEIETRSVIPCFQGGAGEALIANLSASNNVSVSVYYREV